ncbi:putative ATP-dependent RNA helicase Dbp73D [Frankliniella fusca]|uniref:ATP-dependent RNA helicase Dbp73D n=1 Tax=Frankliniella fusca TaxID=407009 RepID=A0AAE1HG28_9NEOP|nr:putative ATP-dependent RNA helicase Dbp73D [Frankliniella fusca]
MSSTFSFPESTSQAVVPWNSQLQEGNSIQRNGPDQAGTSGLSTATSLWSKDSGGDHKSSDVLPGLNCRDLTGNLYPSHLKILTSKLSVNYGLQHVNFLGKWRAGRQLRSACHDGCKRCDSPKLSGQERSIVFNQFWSLGSHQEQWKFIFHAVKVSMPLRKIAPNIKRKKFCSRSYYFYIRDESRRVCKTMFKNTLCICDSWIESALSHYIPGMPPIPDMRGRWKTSRILPTV